MHFAMYLVEKVLTVEYANNSMSPLKKDVDSPLFSSVLCIGTLILIPLFMLFFSHIKWRKDLRI